MTKTLTRLILLIFTVTTSSCDKQNEENKTLRNDEEELIKSFADSISIEDGIGQLFILGIPKDYSQIRNDTILDSLIIKHGIGGVFINRYTLFNSGERMNDNSDEFLSDVMGYITKLQSKSLESKLALPLFTACDFENLDISPIQNGFELPPAAYALSATNDSLLIEYSGFVNGYKLNGLGINMLFGPVLDSYIGDVNCLEDRCFGSNDGEIVSRSSYYLKGLKSNPIISIAKHFPGLGSVNKSPDLNAVPIYQQSINQLDEDIKLFKDLKSGIDGIMMSHAKIENLDTLNYASFSKKIMNKYIDTTLNKKLVVTDDFSNMGAIHCLIDSNKKENYQTISFKAFEAGNDLLLFSHVEQKGVKFNYKEFEKIKSLLTNAIKSRDDLKAKFRLSLYKILCAKIKYGKNAGYIKSVKEYLYNFKIPISNRKSFFNTDMSKRLTKFSIDERLREYTLDKIKSDSELCAKILEKSFSIVNNLQTWDSLKIQTSDSILICSKSNIINQFKELLKDSTYFVSYVEFKSRGFNAYNKYAEEIKLNYKKFKYVIFLGKYKDDADMAEKISNSQGNSFRNKLIFVSINNPSIVRKEFSLNINHLTFFTNHRLVPSIIVKFINGNIKFKKINIAVGSIYLPVMKPSLVLEKETIPDNIFRKDKDLEVKVIKELKKDFVILPKSTFNLFLLVLVIFCTYLFYRHTFNDTLLYNFGKTINERKTPATIVLFIILVLILFFTQETIEKLVSIKSISELILEIKKIF